MQLVVAAVRKPIVAPHAMVLLAKSTNPRWLP
jgi:hypothetical protein